MALQEEQNTRIVTSDEEDGDLEKAQQQIQAQKQTIQQLREDLIREYEKSAQLSQQVAPILMQFQKLQQDFSELK